VYIVKLLLEAEIELTDICAWYEKRKLGLGKDFLVEFNHCTDLLANNPFQFAVNFSEKYRFALLKKFPYSIVYRIDDEEDFILVISVFHQSRNPSKF
jgi:plasmid stabilization system protein ParE